MNQDSRSSGGAGAVVAVLLLFLILLVGVVGLGAGFFWRSVVIHPSPAPLTKAIPADATLVAVTPEIVGTFSLSDLDKKDQLEAPVIAFAPNGDLLVAFASQISKTERSLRLARFRDGVAVGEPKELRKTKIFESVSQQGEKEVRRPIRLLPQLASGGGKVFLGWVEPNEELTTVYYYVAESTDDGETFSAPLRVHESDGAKPAFTGLSADAQGNLVASWLDNRAGIKQPFASIKKADAATFAIESQIYSSPNDSGVCPCCPTTAIIGPDEQVYGAFRNQLDGFRDIYIGQRGLTGEGDFSLVRSAVEKPTWTFDGCPHDGPSLAIDTQNLYVAWMDASSGAPRCYYSMKPLGGGNYAPAQLLSTQANGTEGNAKLASFGEGVVAVWEQATSDATASAESNGHAHGAPMGSSRTIYMALGSRIQSPQGTTLSWQPPQPLAHKDGAFQTRPALALAADSGFAVWNELDEQGKRVVVARLPYPRSR